MSKLPDKNGYFGTYGGQFVPETLMHALKELEEAYKNFKKDAKAKKELKFLLKNYAGRPTPIYYASRLSKEYEVNIYLKREDLLHTGAHKLNNTLGQILLAKYMGKTRIIAETGAGQHGVATATAAALMGMECCIYMGAIDVERQAPNVKRMKLLGADVVRVEEGTKVLKDAVNATLKDWVVNLKNTHYIIGSVVGPHPFPMIVRDFQSVIGKEAKKQIKEYGIEAPDYVVACVGGGSNAAGIFYGFIDNKNVKLIGVEPSGKGLEFGKHAATLTLGRPGILHGSLTYLLQDEEGQILDIYSISAGLDYPGVGPEHSYFKDKKIVTYELCSDEEALFACKELSAKEGIIPALESSHALGYVLKNYKKFKNKNVLINLSGRGDKDLGIIFKEVEL